MGLIDKYRQQIKQLLPPGRAFPRGAGTNWHKLCDGIAAEAARIHERAEDLQTEMFPGTQTEMMTDWEAVWGLPDPCTGQLSTLGERRAALLARMTFIGDQRPGFFIALAASLGYTVTIDENVGGDPTVWRVNAPSTTIHWARAGAMRAGDRICTWGNDLLECAIKEVNPAHLTILFAYG